MAWYVNHIVPENLEAETALWRAVVLRAMKDAAGKIDTSYFKKQSSIDNAIYSAQGWFRANGDGFQTICDVAGLEPEYVRRIAMKHFKPMPKRHQRPRKMTFKPRPLAA